MIFWGNLNICAHFKVIRSKVKVKVTLGNTSTTNFNQNFLLQPISYFVVISVWSFTNILHCIKLQILMQYKCHTWSSSHIHVDLLVVLSTHPNYYYSSNLLARRIYDTTYKQSVYAYNMLFIYIHAHVVLPSVCMPKLKEIRE